MVLTALFRAWGTNPLFFVSSRWTPMPPVTLSEPFWLRRHLRPPMPCPGDTGKIRPPWLAGRRATSDRAPCRTAKSGLPASLPRTPLMATVLSASVAMLLECRTNVGEGPAASDGDIWQNHDAPQTCRAPALHRHWLIMARRQICPNSSALVGANALKSRQFPPQNQVCQFTLFLA